MIDYLEFRIPFKPSFTKFSGFSEREFVDLRSVCEPDSIPLSATNVEFFEHLPVATQLRHPFQSLKSSQSGMSFKIYPEGFGVCDFPHVIIKCSPAKLLQGHNVFGPLNYGLGMREMFSTLSSIYPNLYNMLDIELSDLRAIDLTFFARGQNDFISKQIIQILARTSNRHIRAARQQYKTTANWNNLSTYYRNKAYLKKYEVEDELKKINSQLKLFDKKNITGSSVDLANHKKIVLEKILPFTDNMIRFETRVFARKLEDWGMPTNAFEFNKYLNNNDAEILTNIWKQSFKPIFETLEGHTMDATDEEYVRNKIKLVFETTRSSNRVFNFYLLIRNTGYQRVKEITSRASFWKNEKDLISTGISKATLQNMEKELTNIVPLIRMIDIKFDNQYPENYIEPKSNFEPKLYAIG